MTQVMEQPKQFPTIKEMCEWALTALMDLEYGEQITYGQLSDIIRTNSQQTRGRSAVLKAGRQLLRSDPPKLLINVRGIGYAIANPGEQHLESLRFQKAARRRLNRALSSVVHVALEAMTPEERNRTLMEQVRCAMKLSTDRKLSRVKKLPAKAQLALPSGAKLVELFTKKKA